MAGKGGSGEGDDIAFLREAIGSLAMPRLRLLMLLSAILPPAANLFILSNLPTPDNPDHSSYFAAFAAIVIVHTALAMAILRILNHSPRPAWSLDWSAGTYGLVVLCTIAVGLLADSLFDSSTILSALANQIVSTLIIIPFAPWLVAIAVERPLAWRPAPWFGRLRDWLPALLLWNFLFLVPADALYRIGFEAWLEAGGKDDWRFFVFDGIATAARLFLALALASVAYRRVARV
ncbi:MAG TPA: hypothetical protein VFP12_14790 [Allosphingosinicella sp.]|nr:hypothetical protein [Allosphingosinicella sp.]